MFPLHPRLIQKLIGGYAGAGQGRCGFPRTHCEDEIVCTKFAKTLDNVCTLCYNKNVKRTGQQAHDRKEFTMKVVVNEGLAEPTAEIDKILSV